jgi:hypothetical protein
MSQCPFHKLKDGLPPLIPRIAKLPLDERGYPVPFFVEWPGGKPDFRFASGSKRLRCVEDNLCWVCGEKMGTHKVFVIGPMCGVNLVSSEPPSHLDCARWSVKACPFLLNPNQKRRENEVTRVNEQNIPGIMIKRNPGVMAMWVTKSYKRFSDNRGGWLIRIGQPEEVSWWTEGRLATREEVDEGIETGLPTLLGACRNDLERQEVREQRKRLEQWLPR